MLRTGPRYGIPTEHSSVFMSNNRQLKISEVAQSGQLSSGEGDPHINQVFVPISQSTLQNSQYRIYSQFFSTNMNIGLCFNVRLHFFVLVVFCFPLVGEVLLCRQKNLALRGSVPRKKKSTEQLWPPFPLSRKSATQLFLRVSLNLCLIFHGGFLSHTTLCLNPCLKCPVSMFEILCPCSVFTREPDSPLSQASHSTDHKQTSRQTDRHIRAVTY